MLLEYFEGNSILTNRPCQRFFLYDESERGWRRYLPKLMAALSECQYKLRQAYQQLCASGKEVPLLNWSYLVNLRARRTKSKPQARLAVGSSGNTRQMLDVKDAQARRLRPTR